MKIHFPLFPVLIVLSGMIAGCNPIDRLQTQTRTTLFDDAFRVYSKHLRWGHYQQAVSFITEQHGQDSLSKIPALKDRRISQIVAEQWTLNKEQDKATGTVEISYYLVDRGIVRQATQTQTWIFMDERWLLDTPLPDLP